MRISKIWRITLLPAVFMAGCGGGTDYSGGGPAPIGDITAPTLRSTNPGDTATGVGTNSKLVANFSEAVNPATCTATTFTLVRGVTPVPGTVLCAGKTATFTPTGALTGAAAHTATLTTGIKDLAGNALAANATWGFTTGAADVTAPTVASTDPVDTAPSVPVSNNITATFSEAVDPGTVTAASFTLAQLQSTGPGCAFDPLIQSDPCPPGSAPVDGSVSTTGTVASFVPTVSLKAQATNPNPPSNGGIIDQHYMATVTTGVKDLAGNALAADHAWTFTTRGRVAGGAARLALGAAEGFAVLTKTGVTDTPASAITGDVGASPGSGATIVVTCAEVTGIVHSADAAGPLPCRVTDASFLATAISDMDNAYTDAAGRTAPALNVDLGAGNIGGMTLAPGVYKWTTGVSIPSNVTLAGGVNDVWIFQIAQNLTVANTATVTLSGGAVADNVFWQVGGLATLGTTSNFKGTILSQTSISLGAGAVLNGRALAKTTATLNTNTVSRP